MNHTFYEIAILFFTYSFLAWLAETAVTTIKVKNFRNRGFASGPFCFVYGFTGVLLTIFFQELKNDMFFLFLGSAAVSTAIEWFTGKSLERMKQKKWWDYSGKRWNFDGYICLQYSNEAKNCLSFSPPARFNLYKAFFCVSSMSDILIFG